MGDKFNNIFVIYMDLIINIYFGLNLVLIFLLSIIFKGQEKVGK